MMFEHTQDAADVLAKIVAENGAIASIRLVYVPRPPRSSSRLNDPDALKQYESEALALRSDYGVPFWMAMSFVIESRGLPVPDQMLAAAAVHQPLEDMERVDVNRSEFDAELVRDMCKATADDRILAATSKVLTENGEALHIPMLDFRSKPSEIGEQNAIKVARKLGTPGSVLVSGNSYHFYGDALLTPAEFTKYLAKAILFSPVVDYRWASHQLIEGKAALRISASNSTGQFPEVVSVLN